MGGNGVSKKIIGASARSVSKHNVLNRIVGMLVGARRYLPMFDDYDVLVDLCAGDGVPNSYSQTSSPAILKKHYDCLMKEKDVNTRRTVHMLFVERDEHTCGVLRHTYGDSAEVYHGSSTDDFVAAYIHTHAYTNSMIFVHYDPNQITDWKFSDVLHEQLSGYKFLTTFSTLGCNVGGLKRLPLGQRQGWFMELSKILNLLRSYHDAELFVLDRDASQWAYLVTGPKKWIADEKYRKVFYRAFTSTKTNTLFLNPNQRRYDLRQASYRLESHKFGELVNELFMTKEERVNG